MLLWQCEIRTSLGLSMPSIVKSVKLHLKIRFFLCFAKNVSWYCYVWQNIAHCSCVIRDLLNSLLREKACSWKNIALAHQPFKPNGSAISTFSLCSGSLIFAQPNSYELLQHLEIISAYCSIALQLISWILYCHRYINRLSTISFSSPSLSLAHAHTLTQCTHNTWWLVLGGVTTKEDHPLLWFDGSTIEIWSVNK